MNWKYKGTQMEIWQWLSPKIKNWKAENRPDPIGYFTDGLLRWICFELQSEKKHTLEEIEQKFIEFGEDGEAKPIQHNIRFYRWLQSEIKK